MASLLDEIDARILDVVCSGRGTGVGFGTEAQARAVPSGDFRSTAHDASLRGPTYPLDAFDRAVQVSWLSLADEPEISNEMDATSLRTARFELLVGYVTSEAHQHYVRLLGSENRATAAVRWERRALSDAERIKRALCFAEIAAGPLTVVRLIGLARDGASTREDLGEGRGISITPYQLRFDYTTSGSIAP